MTNDEKEVAIALWKGWKRPDDPEVMKFKIGWIMPEKWWMDPKGVLRFRHDIPKYLEDRNAMIDIISSLSDYERGRVSSHIADLLDLPCVPWTNEFVGAVLTAPAMILADAFLLTIKN